MTDGQEKGSPVTTIAIVLVVVALVAFGAMKLFGGRSSLPSGSDAGVSQAIKYSLPPPDYAGGAKQSQPTPTPAPAPTQGNNGGWPE